MQAITQTIIDAAKEVEDQLNQKDQKILLLQAALGVVRVYGIQSVQPETLWYEARSAGAPKTGPHGTITFSLGEPTVVNFFPVKLGGQSDNVYCLRRLYLTLSPEQQALLETAKNFSVGCEVALSPLGSVQAFELDYQIRKKSGVTINVGLQVLPTGSGWILRGFDFVSKDWKPIGGQVIPGKSNKIQIEATCDDKTVQFTQATVDGVVTPVTFSHPVTLSTPNAPYVNAAYQCDATADAKPYKASVGHFEISFS